MANSRTSASRARSSNASGKGRAKTPITHVSDATQQIAALEARLHQADAMIAGIHRSMAVIEFDLDGTVLTANENFLRTLGFTLSEIQGPTGRAARTASSGQS
jgi:PAS domain-containing protein